MKFQVELSGCLTWTDITKATRWCLTVIVFVYTTVLVMNGSLPAELLVR